MVAGGRSRTWSPAAAPWACGHHLVLCASPPPSLRHGDLPPPASHPPAAAVAERHSRPRRPSGLKANIIVALRLI
jgi:hypothetical protein